MATINPITGQVDQAGITSLDGTNTVVANPQLTDIYSQYQTLFGRAPDAAGAQYWAGTGLTGQELTNALIAGAQGSDVTAYQNTLTPPAPTVPTPETGYGNTKLTTAKQDVAEDFAQKYLGENLTADDWSYIAQNYTGTNLENTIKRLSEEKQVKDLYQTTLGRAPTAEELASTTKKYNWKNIGEGVNTLLGGQVITGDPTIDYVVNQAYKTQLGREGDQPGVDYWKGELAKGNITVNQFKDMFGAAAEEDLIEQGYKEMFGREADTEGLQYWKDTLNTTNKEDIYSALKSGAVGEDLLALSKYLTGQGEDVSSFVTKYLEAEDDLLDEYEGFRKYEIDPTLAGTDYFANVGTAYTDYANTTIDDIFGSGAASEMSADKKQSIIDSLVAGDSTRDDIKEMFQTSSANKNQEASRIANIYAQAFGGDAEDAKALYAKLMGVSYSGTGKVDDEIYNRAKDIFDKSLSSETDAQQGISTLIKDAANKEGAENQKFFTDNPDLLTIYKDVGDTKSFNNAGTGGQYGYYKGIPILKASEVDQVFDKMGTDYIQGNAPDRLDNDIGWDTGSLSAIEARGAAALGVRKTEGYTDENGQTYPATYSGDLTGLAEKLGIDPNQFKDSYKTVDVPKYDSEGSYIGTEKQQVLDKSAQDKLYDAVNEKAKDFYFIAGKTGSGKTNSLGETSAFTRDDVSGNHAAVLYKKEGDKLIPIENTLKYYTAGTELSPGSWFSNTFGGLASIPGIAELSLLIPGVGPGTYAALKAAQTAALGGEFKDIAKAGALSYVGAKYLPQVTSGVSEGLSGAGVTNELLNKTLTGATVGGGIAGLTGKDVGTGALMGGGGGALSYGVNEMLPKEGLDFANELGIDPKYQSIFANTLARLTPTILTGGKIDPTKVLMSYLMSGAKGLAKEQIKEGIK